MNASPNASARPRPSGPTTPARRSCGWPSCWPTSSPASRRSTSRSASRSTRFRPSSGRCSPRTSRISAAIRPTPAPSGSAAPSRGWLGRRYRSPRPIDPVSEILVLDGTREGLFLAAIAAKRWVSAAHRPARDPDPEPVLRGLCGRRGRGRLRAGLSRRHRRERLPARSRRARRRAAGAHRRVLSRLAGEPAGLGRRRGLSRRAWSRSRGRTASWCSPTSATRKSTCEGRRRPACSKPAGAGLRQRGGVPLAVEALEPARPAHRLRRRRQDASSSRSSTCATSRRRRCRCRRRRSRSPPMTTRRMSRRTARSIAPKFDLADQIIGNRYGYQRPAGGFFLWLDVSRAGRQRGGRR